MLATRKAVGDGMDLMLDPACEYNTFGDALKVGRACDEARFFWYEDPYKDGGISPFAHRKLRAAHQDAAAAGRARPRPGAARRPDRRRRHRLRARRRRLRRRHHRRDEDRRTRRRASGSTSRSTRPGPAHRHCMAAIRNTNYYELGLVHPEGAGPKRQPVRSTPTATPTTWTRSTARARAGAAGPGSGRDPGLGLDQTHTRRARSSTSRAVQVALR